MGAFDIQGKDCVFQIKIGDDYFTVVCAKSFTFNPVTDMKETTTVGSGFWKEFRPRKLSYTITFNGMLQVASSNTQEIVKTLFTYQIGFLPIGYQLIYQDVSDNVMIIRGSIYVTSNIFDASPVNFVNATTELQGNGQIEVLDELPQPINIHITSTGDSSIGALIQFRLYNSSGDIVFDSGQLPQASGGNLAHPVDVIGTVQKGNYYYTWQATADSVANEFDLDASPTKSTTFNDGTNSESSVNVQLYDFTVNRNVTFELGLPTPPPTCVPPTIVGSPSLPDGQVGVAYSYSFSVSGSQPFNISNVTRPLWMTISILSGNLVVFSGTPDTAETSIISFDINNACGTAHFSDSIDIAEASPTTGLLIYDFTVSGPVSGIMRIYLDGSMVRDISTTQHGSFSIGAGTVVQTQVIGGGGPTLQTLSVVNNTDSITLYNDTSESTETFSFTTGSTKQYTITGEVQPNT